ncbi:hypothetical protein [Photobacterium kishitanii]|uniref:hypothetical protein n=1 Tax=Photobacterium kishitanii TaxID=318456 RepID=UPI0007F9275B|nr:hypothetical protein [Photobacterium kishitanii]OBU32248.1 hypothetical protein AYY23_03865 [Photobacterium kishitanii]PSW50330.1 hypothetical protein C0W66_05405 [Photobacterium kishitanii]
MSLEQQIGALVKASENLTGAVNGKIGEIDKEVEIAKQQFEEFKVSADDRYKLRTGVKFFVGGQADKFIPVIILLPTQPISNIEIHRSILQEDSNANGHSGSSGSPGTTSIVFEALGASWGHRYGFTHLIAHYHKTQVMLADYKNDYRMSHLVIWLRGGLHYTLYHDQSNVRDNDVKVYSDEINNVAAIYSNKVTIALNGVVDTGSYGVSYPIKTEVNASIPTQYRLGVTNGL